MLDDLQSLACFFLHVDLIFFGFMRCNPKLRDWPNLHMRIHATWVFDLVQFSVFSGCAFFDYKDRKWFSRLCCFCRAFYFWSKNFRVGIIFFLDLGIIFSHSSCSNLKCEIGIIYIWDFRDWKWFSRLCCFSRAFYFG